MNTFLRHLTLAAALFAATLGTPASASDDATAYTAQEQLQMLKEDINTPKIPSKQKAVIREYMLGQARRLKKAGFAVETMRKGEVIVVTMPTDKMFAPNDSALFETATPYLRAFVTYLNNPSLYKLAIAVHSDDTGSDVYQLQLTDARYNAIANYFDDQDIDVTGLIGYPLASIQPLKPNNSRNNRSLNRRIEIYIIPDEGMIQLAQDRKL